MSLIGRAKRTYLETLKEYYQSADASPTLEDPSSLPKKPKLFDSDNSAGPSSLSSDNYAANSLPQGSEGVPDSVLLRRDDLPLSTKILESTDLKEFHQNIVQTMIAHAVSQDTDEEGGPLVPPQRINQAGINALFAVHQLKGNLEQCLQQLKGISDISPADEICSTLSSVEEMMTMNKKDAQKMKTNRAETLEVMEEVEVLIKEIENNLRYWRFEYPDTSPIRIHNENAFLAPTKALLDPVLIAYSLALSQRIFARASEVSANVTLQIMHLYGSAMVALGGPPNILQTRALEATPVQITTVENRLNLNLGVESIIYAVCPSCNYLYEPQSSLTSGEVSYPTTCTHRSPISSPRCNTPLLDQNSKPLKIYEYYPFLEWFAQFVARPEVQRYGRAFCKEVMQNPVAPVDKVHTSDGDIYRELLGPDGKLFVDGGEECRFLFFLHADSFNSEGTTGRNKHRSTGVVTLKCLNLPYHLREDDANVYIPGFWRGPKEPNAVDAQLVHLLTPLFSDLDKAYKRGIKCHGNEDESAIPGPACTSRGMVAGAGFDLKAARPVAGLLDATSHHLCTSCGVFHKECILRTDYENWPPARDDLIREGMQKWTDASTKEERQRIENYYGTRNSAFVLLNYFSFGVQLTTEAMHAIYHRCQHLYFRKALNLTTVSSKQLPCKESNIAFYYDFTHPPRPNPSNASDRRQTREEYLLYLEWDDLSDEESQVRSSRLEDWLPRIMQNDTRSLRDVVKAHQLLSQKRPQKSSEGKKLIKKLGNLRWNSLVYICNDLWIAPVSGLDEIEITKNNRLQRNSMAKSLVAWRTEHVFEDRKFRWPHFTVNNRPSPRAPWALPTSDADFDSDTSDSDTSDSDDDIHIELNDQERREAMEKLAKTMNYDSTVRVGHVHRYLCQPFRNKSELGKLLEEASRDALAFVCLDVNRSPRKTSMGKVTKEMYIQQLISWRISKPKEPLLWPDIHSGEVLSMVHKCIREVLVPSWIAKPPPDSGLKSGGTLKADNWRIIFSLYLPLALLSLWMKESPLRASNYAEMGPVLETSMNLTCASILMAKRSISLQQRELYLLHYRNHIEGLKKNFPGFGVPTHHIGFHIYDFIRLFGPVRNFWAFSGERLIGRLQKIPTNHRPGQFETTLLHSYYKGVGFRRWLLRSDCPPLLKHCHDLLNKAYGFSAAENGPSSLQTGHKHNRIPRDLTKLLDTANNHGRVILHTRVEGQSGIYASNGAPGPGNSFVCFRLPGELEWKTGQIQYIFQIGDEEVKFAIRLSLNVDLPGEDPFKGWWAGGFEAKLVSTSFDPDLTLVDRNCILGHTARWNFWDGMTVAINMSQE